MRLITLMCITAVLFSCKPNSPAVISVVPKDTTVIFPTPTDSIIDIIPIIHHPKPKDTVIIPPVVIPPVVIIVPPKPKDTVVIIVPNTDTIIIPLHPPALPVLPIDTIIIPHPIIITPTPFVPIVPTPIVPVVPVTPVVELKPFQVISDIDNVTIQDLKDVLQEYKDGRQINIIKVPLESRTGQTFYISADQKNVELHYTTKQSLENAVYTYLDMLGIRWYNAGDNWLVKPTVLNTVTDIGTWKEPTFRNRNFFGTGGLETALGIIDPGYNYKNNWNTWKRRNRFNYDFPDVGHAGQVFYSENKSILDANPQWFNSDQGRQSGRLRIDNDSAVKVYKDWAFSKYNSNSVFNMISTDPEDGRGGYDDPLPYDGFMGIAKWNIADKWWWLTNEVSKLFDENNNNTKIGALSYGDGPYNALAPKFKLRKNVYPIIVPYAFQTAYQPNQMVRTWANSIDGNMGIYDYWNITQWSLGLPQFNIYSMPEKLKFWAANKVVGMNIETTAASGPMGHSWWLGGQLQWDSTKNIDTLFNKYLHDCFGAAWQPMGRMYKRWSLNYQGNAEVDFSLRDLKEATDSVQVNGAEWKRLNDVKSYLHFMKLMANRTNTKTNNDSIYQYIYSINNRIQVQTASFKGQQYLGLAPEPLSAYQLTNSDVENQFVSDLSTSQINYTLSNFIFDYNKVVSVNDTVNNNSWNFGIFPYETFLAPFTGPISINLGSKHPTEIKIFTDDSVYVKETVDTTNYSFLNGDVNNIWYMKNISLNILKGKIYSITARQSDSRVVIKTPQIVLFHYQGGEDFSNYYYPNKYFYVPIGRTEIVFTDYSFEGMNNRGYMVTPDGVTLYRTALNAQHLYKVTVPQGQDGKVWKANFGHPLWNLVNVPNYVSLQKFIYTESIVNDPIDTVIPPPALPVIPIVELKPFEINADIDNETIQDLKDVLKDYKDGREINIKKVSLDQRTGQAFYISANKKSVELKYTTKQSLENAVYTYLDMLGINWYGAGINWLVKKPILNTINIEGKWIEPTFRNRTFDGTGGLDYGLSTDPDFLYKKNWYTFKRRNRFNGDFQQPSHSGQAFYISNVALCNAHPEWFNGELGKQSGRIRVEISEAVQAYKDWYKRYPNVTDSFVTINTDPEDGRGGSDDPLPPDGFKGINNWNASDKWWYFANEIAKDYDSNSTKLHIAALAYGDGPFNTLVPKFPLKKNVFPQIIPYAFQTAYLPKQMVRVWHANTAGNMAIYDYWNITQWSVGLPQFNIYDIVPKLTFWRQNAINCIQQETTDAGGPMGHVFWLAGQMEFDTTKNFDTVFKKYLVDCFGAGWKPMKNMFDRWSLNYQYNQDVNFSLKDLKDASDSVILESPEWKRINDLKAYVHFMKLMAQRNGTQPNNDSIYQYIYTIHQRMLVQTAAMTGQHYLGPDPQPISDHQLTEAEIEANFASDIAALPVEYPISNFVFDYDKATYIDSMSNDSWRYGIFSGGYFKANYTGTFSVDMGGQGITKVKIFTDDSVYVNENVSPTDFTFNEFIGTDKWYMKNYVINVVKGQTYNITTYYGFGRIKVKTPNIIIFNRPAANDFDNAGYPNRYFYVPKGTTKIAYQDGEPQPMNGRGYLVTPDGVALVRKATTAKDVYTVDVPKGMDGKVWIANMGHSGWSFANIPNITTLQFFSYTE